MNQSDESPMRCNHYRAKFTERYAGELSAGDLEAVEAHCQSCALCAEEWTNYVRSVEALKGAGVATLPDEYVDSLLAATLGAQEAGWKQALLPRPDRELGPAPRPRPWTHALAALAGAALMLLLMRVIPSDSQPEEQIASQGLPVVIPIPVPFGPSASRPKNADPAASQDSGSPEADSVAQVATTRPERIRYVNRAIFVPIPTPMAAPASPTGDSRARSVTTLMASAADSLARITRSLERNTEGLVAFALEEQRLARELAARAPLEPTPVVPVLVASSLPERRKEKGPATLGIQRREERVSLSTHGTLGEVVPALIQRLDDEDPAIGELVQIRLQEIWSERTGAPFESSPLRVGTPELDIQDIGWRKWVRREQNAPEQLSPKEEWTSWWESEQITLASASF